MKHPGQIASESTFPAAVLTSLLTVVPVFVPCTEVKQCKIQPHTPIPASANPSVQESAERSKCTDTAAQPQGRGSSCTASETDIITAVTQSNLADDTLYLVPCFSSPSGLPK
jgi:hypothetical protein